MHFGADEEEEEELEEEEGEEGEEEQGEKRVCECAAAGQPCRAASSLATAHLGDRQPPYTTARKTTGLQPLLYNVFFV